MILSAITAIIKQHSPYSHFVFQFYKYSISWWCIFSTCLFSGWESVPCNEPEVCSSIGQDGQRDAGPLTPALLWQSPPKVVLWGENIMVFYLETIYIQDQYPEEGYGWINLQNVFFFFICLPCSKRSPKEEAAMLPSSRQLCTFFVPAGFNGPIGNYADYNYADEVLCKYIYIYMGIFFIWCCCWETGTYWNMYYFSF